MLVSLNCRQCRGVEGGGGGVVEGEESEGLFCNLKKKEEWLGSNVILVPMIRMPRLSLHGCHSGT